MKILLNDKEILSTGDEFSLIDGWYVFNNCHYEEAQCVVVDANLPDDFKRDRYTFENGSFVETESYVKEKLYDVRSLRAKEYPPITDYIDGIVKGDTAQVKAYIDACLAVKEKYPKPK